MSASVRLRAEAWDWFDTSIGDGSYVFGAVLARVAASQQLRSVGWRLELAAPLLLSLPSDALAPMPQGQLGLGPAYWVANDSAENVAAVFLKQAFVRVGVAPGKPGASARAGRFELVDGTETTPANATLAAVKRDRIAHRLVGNFGFSHVQRSVDGVHFNADKRGMNLTAAAFRPTAGVFDADAWGSLDIKVGYAALSGRGTAEKHPADWRAFVVGYDDNRGAITAQPEIWTYGAHYLQALIMPGAVIDVLGWAAVQNGNWGPLDHNAHAFAIEAGVQPKALASLKPWLRAGLNKSSGDKAAADGEHGTFFSMLPTPRIYARLPFHNAMNLQDAFAELIIRPSSQFTIRSDYHDLKLSEPTDSWYAGGGAFQEKSFGFTGRPANGSTDLAGVFDVSLEYRARADLTVTGYVGFANGGAVIERIYPAGANARFGYIELEWRR